MWTSFMDCPQLEDPLLTTLHKLIVAEGDYERPEQLVETAVEGESMQKSFSRQPYERTLDLIQY